MARALKSEAEQIFLLNNDTTLEQRAIEVLRSADWDVAIPKILFYDQPETIWAAGARWRPFPPAVVMNGYLRTDGAAYDRPQPLQYATGCALLARRQVFDVRFKGDGVAVLTDLRDLGAEWHESDDGVRLFLPEGHGPETIFRLAKDCGAQVRHLRPGAETLEDVFLRALGHEIQD